MTSGVAAWPKDLKYGHFTVSYRLVMFISTAAVGWEWRWDTRDFFADVSVINFQIFSVYRRGKGNHPGWHLKERDGWLLCRAGRGAPRRGPTRQRLWSGTPWNEERLCVKRRKNQNVNEKLGVNMWTNEESSVKGHVKELEGWG